MIDGFIKVCAATVDVEVADCIYNTQKIINAMQKAKHQGVKLIVFPELCITGYSCGDLFFQNKLLSSAINGLLQIRDSSKDLNMLVVVGLPLLNEQKLYNCAAVIFDGKILGIVPKTNIPNYSEFYEARHFFGAPEENTYIFIDNKKIPFGRNLIFSDNSLQGFTLAVEICEDIWSLSPPSVQHARAGATVIANLSSSSEFIGKADYRKKLVGIQSAKLLCAYIYSDSGLGESTTDIVFSGHNIIAEVGSIIAESKMFQNSLLISEIDTQKIAYERRRISSFPQVDNKNYMKIQFCFKLEKTNITRFLDNMPFVPKDNMELRKRCEFVLSMQETALKKRIKHTNSEKIILGLSGGLDSTLALLACLRVITSLKKDYSDILAVNMPGPGTSSETKNNAINLAIELGVTLKIIDISKQLEQHFGDIGHDKKYKDTTYENSQARVRTMILMNLANKYKGLVVGTGDLSELALGFTTYNGDHMSMYGINASVPKTMIPAIIEYEISNIKNNNLKSILSNIINTPISPELLPPQKNKISQVTQEIIGPYELHDFFLYYAVRWGFSPKKIYRLAKLVFTAYQDKELLNWLKVFYERFFKSQFKRSCIPDGPKIGSVALSPRGDMRMPSDANVRIWLDEVNSL